MEQQALADHIVAATTEVFTMMLDVQAAPVEREPSARAPNETVLALVGMAGSHVGSGTINCDADQARRLAGRMLAAAGSSNPGGGRERSTILVAHDGRRAQPLLGLYPSDDATRSHLGAAVQRGERRLQSRQADEVLQRELCGYARQAQRGLQLAAGGIDLRQRLVAAQHTQDAGGGIAHHLQLAHGLCRFAALDHFEIGRAHV